MSDYTPTTDEVRAVWSVWSGYGGLTNRTDDVDLYGDREAEFDHWLNQVKADAWDEGAHAAWERSTPEVNAARYHWRHAGEPRNPYRSTA